MPHSMPPHHGSVMIPWLSCDDSLNLSHDGESDKQTCC